MIAGTNFQDTRIITGLNLTGEWPVLLFADGSERTWEPHYIVRVGEWDSMDEGTRRSLIRFLRQKGRQVRKQKAGIEDCEHWVHVPAHSPIPIIGTEQRGFYVRLDAPSCRFEDNISIHVDNCDSEEEAEWMVRQFLEDLLICGLSPDPERMAA